MEIKMNIKELTNEKIQSLSFEEALSLLDDIISAQSNGSVPLEDSIHMYEIGIGLKSFCEKYLNDAKLKVEKISFLSDGSINKEEFK